MSAVTARIGTLQRKAPLVQLAVLVGLFVYGSWTIAGFTESQSVRSMLVLAALLGFAAAGQTLVILIGALDFSVPGLIVLGAVMISELCGSQGWPFLPAFLLVVLICGLTGTAVGYSCHRWQISPIIVTLGVSAIAAGAVQVWTNSDLTGAPPGFLTDLVAANGTTFGFSISPIVVIWILFTIAMAVFLHRTRFGRKVYATGANPYAAEFALVKTRRVWTALFCVSAVLSGIVGVLLAGFSGADATLGDPYLFQGLTAVIVGGTAFMGSRGDYTYTAIGALILTVLTTIFVGLGWSLGIQQIIFGALILVVVAGYGRETRLRDRI